MPKLAHETFVEYPYKVVVTVAKFAPGENMPGVKREFPDQPYNNPDGSPGDDPEYETGLKQGERSKVKGIQAIYYDAAQNPNSPDWHPLNVNVADLADRLEKAVERLRELENHEPPTDPLDQ